MKPFSRVAIAVVESAGRYLVGIRPPGSVLAGLVEFPGGKIDPGELPEDAAVRECLEETGLAVSIVQKMARISHQYDHGPVELHFFACRPLDDTNPQPPFRWANADELSALEFPAANAPILRSLCKSTKLAPQSSEIAPDSTKFSAREHLKSL